MIGVGSSREREARGLLKDGNSIVLADGLEVSDSGGLWGSLGHGESGVRDGGDFFSTGAIASGGAVVERLGVVRSVTTGETFPPLDLAGGSGTTGDVGLGRAKP